MSLRALTDAEILAARPPRESLDPWRPGAFFVEDECSANGSIQPVATIFLTNKECPFRCTMCDLWKHTVQQRVPLDAIPTQIDYALERLPTASYIKLYNAGNFFDAQAIPREDYPAIADRVRRFTSVIVENHPRLTDDRVLQFRDLLETRLEVALGLETIHPQVLLGLNKQMTVSDFDRAAAFLKTHQIGIRVFLLLRPPGMEQVEAIDWTVRSALHAFDQGADCCSIIPTRAGNGYMDHLEAKGDFTPPSLGDMETAFERTLQFRRGRVFVDLWDAHKFSSCTACGPARIERLHRMNLSQTVEEPIACSCPSAPSGI
jgi:radical SAM enzyme (TIGR01210 family)